MKRLYIGVLFWIGSLGFLRISPLVLIAQTPPILQPVMSLVGEGKLEDAFERTRQILKTTPQCYECYTVLAILADTLDRADQIIAPLRQGIAFFPHDTILPTLLAQIYFQQQQYDSVIAVLQPYQSVLPSVARQLLGAAYAQRAYRSYQRQYYDRALTDIQQAVRFDSTQIDYWRLWFQLARHFRRCDWILQGFRAISSLQPTDADFYLIAAECAVRDNQLHRAEAILQQARQTCGPQKTIDRLLAQVLLYNGKAPQAYRMMQQLLKQYARDRLVWEQAVEMWIYWARYDSARAVLRQMISRFPTAAGNYWLRIGALFEKEGRFQQARQVYWRALDTGTVDAMQALEAIAWTYWEEQQPDSILSLLSAAATARDSARLWWLLGEYYDAHQHVQQAQWAYEQALRCSPDSTMVANFVVFSLFRQRPELQRRIVRNYETSSLLTEFLRWSQRHQRDTARLLALWKQLMEEIEGMRQQVDHRQFSIEEASSQGIDWESRRYTVLMQAATELYTDAIQLLRPRQLRQFFQQLIADNSTRLISRLFYARWLLTRGQQPEAMALLDEMTVLEPSNPEVRKLRAMVAQQRRDYRTALLEVLRALQRRPQDTALYQQAIDIAQQGGLLERLMERWEIQYEGRVSEQPLLRQALRQVYRYLGMEEKIHRLEEERSSEP